MTRPSEAIDRIPLTRPSARGSLMRTYSLKLSTDDVDALNRRVEIEGRTGSAIMRDALRQYIEREDAA